MTPGKATTTLPRHVTEASRASVLLGPYTQDSKERRNMLRILLAEDAPLIVEGLSELLANEGYAVVSSPTQTRSWKG